MRLSAIVLAAGRGRRLGTFKPMLEIPDPGGSADRIPMLAAVVRQLVGVSGPSGEAVWSDPPTVVVAERDRDRVEPTLPGRSPGGRAQTTRCRWAFAPEPAERSDSIRAGLAACPDSDGWLFAMCDQPLLRSSDYAALVHAAREAPECIVSARFAGERGTPCLFPRRFADELRGLRGRHGGKSVIARHPEAVRFVDLDPGRARDIDTPEDYSAVFGVPMTR